MTDKSLYQQILGDTTPWSVAAVSLNVKAQEIEIEMALDGGELGAAPCAAKPCTATT